MFLPKFWFCIRSPNLKSIESDVGSYYSEISCYDPAKNNNLNSKSALDSCVVGHYTTLMWKETTEIGCAIDVCDGYKQHFSGCHFGNTAPNVWRSSALPTWQQKSTELPNSEFLVHSTSHCCNKIYGLPCEVGYANQLDEGVGSFCKLCADSNQRVSADLTSCVEEKR